MSANRNKESIVLDLKDPSDAEVLAALVRRADVLLENFRVGVLDRLGFSVERLHELNPRLVIGSITGFGHDGPEAQPRRLRPDRAGRGRADVGDRHRAADQGRRPDRRSAGRDEPRLRRGGGAARAARDRSGTRGPHLAALRSGRGARLPGHPVAARWRGAGHRRCAPPGDRAVRAVRDRVRPAAGRGGLGEPLEEVRARPSGSTPTTRASSPTASGSRTATT